MPEWTEELRSQFPVVARHAYLNAGTNGPLPRAAAEAAVRELEVQTREGRPAAYFQRRKELVERVRASFASVIGAAPENVALATSTTQAAANALLALDLGRDDEVVTSDEEHIGLLAVLQALRRHRGVTIRAVPLEAVAEAVGPRTRLVACSHVSWVTGRVAPRELAEVDVPVLLDAAQSVGAIPTDVSELGCAILATSGQKWLCGPDGVGFLYLSPELIAHLSPTAPGFAGFVDPDRGLDAQLHADARRFDTPAVGCESLAAMEASLGVLEGAGWGTVHRAGPAMAERFAEALRAAGREVCPRGATTLVGFHSDDPVGERESLTAKGVLLRPIPGRPLLRASVGAWNDNSDLGRLIDALARGAGGGQQGADQAPVPRLDVDDVDP